MSGQGEICFLFGMTVLLLCYFCVQRLNRDRFLIKTKYPCSSCVIETNGLKSETVILSRTAERRPILRNFYENASVVETTKTGIETPQLP